MRQRTADISVIFVRAAQSRVAERVCTRQPTRIMKFRYRKTILSCMPGQILLPAHGPPGESYTSRTTVIVANCTFLVYHYEILR